MHNVNFSKSKRYRMNTVSCLMALVLLLVSTFGTTQAAWKYANESVHIIDTIGVKARIAEEYIPAQSVYPGDTIDKVVNVENTGSGDAIVRIKVEKAWGEARDDAGKLIANDTFSTDNIHIEYDTVNWFYDESDGYFYYKGVLSPGETTLTPLFREFTVDQETGNEYQGLTADIFVKMECVQAVADGVSVWGKTLEELSIVYTPEEVPQGKASVTFTGGSDSFVFAPSEDLFNGFKYLAPGETRGQIIGVTNGSDIGAGVEIFLRAEDINQSFDDPETLARVTKLLREYATIVVTDDDGNIIYSGPIWGEPYKDAANPDSMRYDISLGIFATGESKTLNVQLQMDPDMGNEYQNLLGLIKWVWSAQDISDETITISGSKTWRHGKNPVSERPKELIIYVKAGETVIATETVSAADHWKWSFIVEKYDKFGNEIEYTIDEEPIPGYTTTINGSDVTNTHESYEEVIVSGNKTWEHRGNTNVPVSIAVHVKNDGVVVASKLVTAPDNWSWSFNLPKYDSNGNEAKYIIEEDRVSKYTLVKRDGYNLVNRYVGESYSGDYPKTDDNTNLLLWAGTMTASTILLVLLLVKRKKDKKRAEQLN